MKLYHIKAPSTVEACVSLSSKCLLISDFFLYCIQQLKCQDHASKFAWDDVLSTRYYNILNNIIVRDLKKHFSFQFTQNYSGPFFSQKSGQFMFKGPDQSRC